MNNPFEDPDVKAAQTTYNNSAYEDVSIQQQPLASMAANDGYIDSNTVNLATKVGGTLAANAAKTVSDDYKKQTATQSDHNPMPEPPNWCIRLFNWIPIRWFAFLGGLLLIALPIVEIIYKTSVMYSLIYVYLIFFGLLTISIESPTFILTRKLQLQIFFWFRLLSRSWGRAVFYIFVSVLCFRLGDPIPIFVGVWMLIIGIILIVFSKMAAKKYVRIYNFIAAGCEKDALKIKLDAKFDELDTNHDQFIGADEIVKVAQQAGRTLSNTERHAIETFLDVSCNGRVSKNDWRKQFLTYNESQKYL